MKKISIIVLLCIISTPFLAQKGFRETDRWVRMKMLHDEPGKLIDYKNLVLLHMKVSTQNGTELKNTWTQGNRKKTIFPAKFSSFKGDLYACVTSISKGDSAEFAINADSTFLYTFRKPLPPSVREGEDLYVTIKVYDVITDIKKYKDSLAKVNAKKLQESPKQIAEEDKQIMSYLKKNNLSAKKTKSGLYYIIKSEGNPELKPDSGSFVNIYYDVNLLDGTSIENNRGSRPFGFTIDTESVIKGWDEGIKLIGSGGEIQLFIPSRLAFLHLEKGKIKPYSILVSTIMIDSIN